MKELITKKEDYLNRRQFLKKMGFTLAAVSLAACAPALVPAGTPTGEDGSLTPPVVGQGDELGGSLTSREAVTGYNNFYEFSLDKGRVADLARALEMDPWQVEVGGLVEKPQSFSMQDIYRSFPEEERIYRMRCVEGWSMVIPWLGFPLAKLLEVVQPKPEAKYVYFVSAAIPEQMPGLANRSFPWPYDEGLRLDEAMHDLTILSTGLYGERLLPQNGAPLRLVVPWKYGFKSIKSIVRIELTAEEPPTFWNRINSHEYGFYANVNPKHSHPRWSQADEIRIGERDRRATLMFNGYEEQVAGLYAGMDLDVYY